MSVVHAEQAVLPESIFDAPGAKRWFLAYIWDIFSDLFNQLTIMQASIVSLTHSSIPYIAFKLNTDKKTGRLLGRPVLMLR